MATTTRLRARDDATSSDASEHDQESEPKLRWQPGLESYLRDTLGPILRLVQRLSRAHW